MRWADQAAESGFRLGASCGIRFAASQTLQPRGDLACGSAGCASGQLSCAGCTTYDYTINGGDDSCGFCMSFESDSPQRCRCI